MTYYVYIDFKADQTPFYVGKGTEDRVKELARNNEHFMTAANSTGWYRKVVFTGDEKSCLRLEKALIQKYGRVDIGTGSLVNKTNGNQYIKGEAPNETKGSYYKSTDEYQIRTKRLGMIPHIKTGVAKSLGCPNPIGYKRGPFSSNHINEWLCVNPHIKKQYDRNLNRDILEI